MSDLGETFSGWRGMKQSKRRDNKCKSTTLLQENGINFESKNEGIHLIIENKIDFWPSTGLWIVRGQSKKKRGVFRLLKYLEELKSSGEE